MKKIKDYLRSLYTKFMNHMYNIKFALTGVFIIGVIGMILIQNNVNSFLVLFVALLIQTLIFVNGENNI